MKPQSNGSQMTRINLFSSPSLLGFEELEHMLERLTKASADAYPPYNIERVKTSDAVLHLRIVLAVAGFTLEELSIILERNQLLVRGRQDAEGDEARVFLHRGIAARQFQRSFVLAEGIEITAATLKNGLLTIDLQRPEAEAQPRTIPIVDLEA